MKPILLGEAPARTLAHEWRRPLFGRSTKIVLDLLDPDRPTCPPREDYARLQELFYPMNAIKRYEDAYPWTHETEKIAAASWTDFVLDWHENSMTNERLVVVCLGRHAAIATGHRGLVWGTWSNSPLIRYTVIPHPSGLNRMYNSQDTQLIAGITLREALRKAR
jgi:uracil-DNA glycosylase